MDAGTVDVDGTPKAVDVKLCGDNKMAADAMLCQGAGTKYGCNYCRCPTDKFLDSTASYPPRTLQNIKQLAHLETVDQCEGCGVKVVSTQAEADEINAQGGRIHGQNVSARNPKAIAVCTGNPDTDPRKPWKTKFDGSRPGMEVGTSSFQREIWRRRGCEACVVSGA